MIVTLALWVAGLCAAMQFAKIGLVLPELERIYPDAGAAIGLLVSTISFVGAALGLLAGALAARIGMRRLLLGGLAFGAAVSLAQAAFPPLPILLASRIVEGISHLAIVIAAPTLLASIATERMRPAAMTLWGTFFGVAFSLTAWIGLPLVEARGVGALWIAHGGLTALAALALVVLLPARTAPRDDGPWLTLRDIAARHKAAWTSAHLSAAAAGWLFYTLTFVALLAIVPGLVPPDARAFTAAALPLASIIASLTVGVMLLRLTSAVGVIATGFGLALALCPALLLWPDASWPGIGLFAALGLVQGASFAAVPELNERTNERALANGALVQAGNIGNACGTPLLLLLLSTGGPPATIGAVALCYVAGLAAHAWLARLRARTAH